MCICDNCLLGVTELYVGNSVSEGVLGYQEYKSGCVKWYSPVSFVSRVFEQKASPENRHHIYSSRGLQVVINRVVVKVVYFIGVMGWRWSGGWGCK